VADGTCGPAGKRFAAEAEEFFLKPRELILQLGRKPRLSELARYFKSCELQVLTTKLGNRRLQAIHGFEQDARELAKYFQVSFLFKLAHSLLAP